MQEIKITLPKIRSQKKKKKIRKYLEKSENEYTIYENNGMQKNSAQKETQYKCLSLKTPQIHSLI